MARVWVAKTKSGNQAVGWYENGKRHSKVCYSPARARELRADIEHRLNMGLPNALLTVPWDNLTTEYLRAKEINRRAPGTLHEIRGMLNRFARLVGRIKSTHIGQEHIDLFKERRGAECKSANTLNKDLANLKAFIRWYSIDRAYIRPGLKITLVKATIRPFRALSEEQIATLLRYLKVTSANYYIRALLALCAGLDVGTIDNIMVHDIDFANDTMDTFRPKKGKWHQGRPIQKAVIAEISNFLAEQPEGQFRLMPDRYQRERWVDLCLGAGVKTTFHNLRKTYASLLVRNGVSLATAQSLLDHESIVTTRKWYIDVTGLERPAVESLPVDTWINGKV